MLLAAKNLLAATLLVALLLLPREASADCASYCAAVTASCTGSNAQYGGPDAEAQCLASCAHFPPGQSGETTGNSVACREHWAGQAASDPATHCPKAGPAGASTCGFQCVNFCDLSLLACTGADAVYDDALTCNKVECSFFFGANDPYTADPSDVTDSFRCRMYQLTRAAQDPTLCGEHGGPNGNKGNSTVCVEPVGPGEGGGGAANGAGGASTGGEGGGPGAGGAGTGASTAESSGAGVGPRRENDEGCSMAAPAGAPGADPSWLGLASLALLAARRRRAP